MQFDAGAIAFRLMMVGKQAFLKDQADVDKAIEKTGKSAKDSKGKLDESGKSTDEVAKKSRAAKKPLEDQAKATDTVGQKSQESAKKQREQAASTEDQKRAAEDIGRTLLTVGAAITAVVGLAVAGSAQFEQAMSQTSAAVMATREEQEALGESALRAGQDTAYSATEAAAAQEELAKAGLEVTDIVGGGLNGALALAAAGQLEVARSAEIMATTLKQYNLEADQAGHVSDLLAAGAGKAQGSVEDLGLALSYAGPVAAGLGLSIEETTGVLGLFASQGILADRAGTGLRGMLMSLTSPSQIAARTMEEYGIAVFNADGSMKSMAEIADQLQAAMGHLTEAERSQALGRIFGNEQITAARVLYQGGAAAVEEWTKNVDDAGYAERQAAQRTDNLIGDLERLGGAFETALIKSGSGANEVLRGLVQSVEGAVDWFGQLPDPVQQTALGLGVALGAVTLFAGGAVTLVGKLSEIKQNLDLMNTSMSRTAIVGGLVGLALTGVIALVGSLAAAHQEAQRKAREYADTLEEGTNAATDATRALVVENLRAAGAFEWAEKLGINMGDVTRAALGNEKAMAAVNSQLEKYSGWNSVTVDEHGAVSQAESERAVAAQRLSEAINGENDAIARGVREAEQMEEAMAAVDAEKGAATETSVSAADAYLTESGAVEELNNQLDELIAKIMESNDANQDAISANAGYREAVAEVDETIRQALKGVDGFSTSIDESTVAGSANAEMFADLASKAQDAALKQYELDGNTKAYKESLEASKQALIDRITALTGNADAAKELADRIFQIPPETEWEVIAQTQAAQEVLDKFVWSNDNRTITMKVAIPGVRPSVGNDGGPGGFADGGIVTFHSNGSLSENHIAQIARAGEMRVWAEPETGGEAYIPLAESKRARSEMIMAETARRLGGMYIPADARTFADGGSTRTLPAVSAPAVAGPLIGNLVLQSTGNLHDDLGQVTFQLRKFQRGGRRG